MKKIFLAGMAVLFCLAVTGCRSNKLVKEEYNKTTSKTTEIVIE